MNSKGVGWLKSSNKDTIERILRIHNRIFAGYHLKTYLMGYPYDTLAEEEDEDDQTDIELEKRLMKMKFQEHKERKAK
jgi:hypothetical protein